MLEQSFQSSLGPRGPSVHDATPVDATLHMFQSSLGPRGPSVCESLECRIADATFQSSLGPRGPSVHKKLDDLVCTTGFQSSLGPRGPSVRRRLVRVQRSARGFNPRSALAGRASSAFFAAAAFERVSILARPSRAERPTIGQPSKWLPLVSILARPSRAERRRQTRRD